MNRFRKKKKKNFIIIITDYFIIFITEKLNSVYMQLKLQVIIVY